MYGDLDLFYGKVKFGNLGFSMGKSENSRFFHTCDIILDANREIWTLKSYFVF